MSNIIDYVKTKCNNNFIERFFTKEDAVVLSRVSYFKFDEFVEPMSPQGVTIEELNDSPKKDVLFTGSRFVKEDAALLEAMAATKRFKNVRVCFYESRLEVSRDIQFAAMTFMIPGAKPYVVFRGTDETIVGWKEDLYLALNRPIGGQKLSAGYLNRVSTMFRGQFNVGGHSKGGNLAIYGSMNCREGVKRRISNVFIFDAPGFRPEVLEECSYNKIRSRVISIIPRSSIVGMLFGCDENSIVVGARSVGMNQHCVFNWTIPVEYLEFEETEITEQHRAFLDSVNKWIFSLDEEELARVIELVEKALTATEFSTITEISKESVKAITNVIKAGKGVSDETKDFLGKMWKTYVNIAKEMILPSSRGKAALTKKDEQ